MKVKKLNKECDRKGKCRYDFVKQMLEQSEGMETVEYAVMAALTIASLVVALGALGLAISGRFDGITAML